ncbi:4'-phosphopantetheinyl transferase superfamily protein [Haloechinothrix sp. LS1_15]|uniref:4'-phosphopantetheinyl transferase family protein n=1 Tax=Haloechinothrix sp. LS1_15 TaxID=2652248 RepID=UPI0029474189|nr:4'-phosphopantetheinyl transferase superfamily protein [Haloechinothrix sp. LS1_15]MDV6014330.1 4'-phosphopantetheinyl transferase superfamily protein [Haloechinothrix sp. LS1_15]
MHCTVLWSPPLPDSVRFRDLLSEPELERFEAYRLDADRRRFLTGRVMARHAVAERTGAAAGDIVLDARCSGCGKHHGKPRVVGTGEQWELSIAHSGDWVGVALAKTVQVGLDVEAPAGRSAGSVNGLIDYTLDGYERVSLTAVPDEARERSFLRYWVRKEAVMKAVGRGLQIPLRGVSVSAPWEPPLLRGSTDASLHPDRISLHDLSGSGDHPASVAVLTTERVTVTERQWGAR